MLSIILRLSIIFSIGRHTGLSTGMKLTSGNDSIPLEKLSWQVTELDVRTIFYLTSLIYRISLKEQ